MTEILGVAQGFRKQLILEKTKQGKFRVSWILHNPFDVNIELLLETENEIGAIQFFNKKLHKNRFEEDNDLKLIKKNW